MSRKFHAQVLIGFFLTVSIIVTITIIRGQPPLDPDVRDARKILELDRVALQRQHLRRNADLWFYGLAGLVTAAGLSGLIIASGFHRERVKRAMVHTYKIGQSEIVVHERDLSLAWPIATGLMNAEKLEHINGGLEKAVELYTTIARVQNDQMKAFLGTYRPQSMTIVPALPEPASVCQVPTFHELLTSGVISHGKPLVFGYLPDGSPRTGSWQDIFSGAIGGQSGYGKTSTLRSLIAQSLLQGIHFWIIDYHYPHPESLLMTLGDLKDSPLVTYAEYDIDAPEILQAVNATIDRRKRREESSSQVKVLCIDEVLQIVKNCDLAGQVIERIGTEGRKMGVYGLFSAQSWKADRVGGSTARDNLTSKFAHHMERKQADLLLQDSDHTRIVKKLRKGQALFCPHNGLAEVLYIPYCAPDDMRLMCNLVNTAVNSQPVDCRVDQSSQLTGLVKAEPVDLVDQVKESLKNDGDFSALVQSTGLDKAYVSRILNHKQAMSRNAEARFQAWLQGRDKRE